MIIMLSTKPINFNNMQEITYAQEIVLKEMEKKRSELDFQDNYSDYSDGDGDNYGDSSSDWT